MNTRMWENPATQRNVQTLRATGVRMVGPASGRLACGTEGMGRMAEPQEILAAIEQMAGNRKKA
jgi:phosphopantothenoylcysteine decarboxylase/phosphopantothenate--cysteine ligase